MEVPRGSRNKVPVNDPRWSPLSDICELPPQLLVEVENFLLAYKKPEAKEVASEGWRGCVETGEYLLRCRVKG